jgi:hypothetical protein
MTPQIYLISNPTKPTHRRLSFKDDMTTFEKGLGWASELVAGDDAVTPPVREAMGWPCEIETADFAKDTITLKMKSGDYKVSAGHHWLSTSAKQEQRAVSEQLGEPVAHVRVSGGMLGGARRGKGMSELPDGDYSLYITPLAKQEQGEPDFSKSKTLLSELWKNPLYSLQDRLLMADGAVSFRDEVIANLRKQQEQGEPVAKYSDIVSDGGFDPRNQFDATPQQRKPLPPVEGDLLPQVGSKVLIYLASQEGWVEHTVVGYYVWGGLDGREERMHRVFVRVVDADGILNARMLRDVRPVEAAHGIAPQTKSAAQEGWKLLPIEPTFDQIIAAAKAAKQYMDECGVNSPTVIYQAMLAAAPQGSKP